MKLINTILILVACAVLQGCTHRYELTLDKVERLQIGATSSEVEHAFGKPTEIITSETSRNSTEWFYAVGDYNRAVFEIDRTTGQLFSKFWDVREGEPERGLETALGRYPNARFKSRDSKIRASHGGPGFAWYDDSLSGVSVQFRKDKNAVEAIVWCKEQPKRSCRKD
jgi:hypothetical protein